MWAYNSSNFSNDYIFCFKKQWEKEKYRGMFEIQKSGDKTSSGEIGLDIRTHASPKVGQDQVSYDVCLMQLSRDYAVTRRITLKLYNTVQQRFKSQSKYRPPSSVGSAIGLKSKDRRFEPRVNHFFSSSNVRLLASRSLQMKTNSQNDWSATNQMGYTETGFLSLVYL